MEKFSIESIFLFRFLFGAAFPERERDDEENARESQTRENTLSMRARDNTERAGWMMRRGGSRPRE